MGFVSGAITFKRLFVDGARQRQPDEALVEKLSARAMGADSVRTADKTEIGWTSGEHILDTEFDYARNAVGDGLFFALRIDTNKVPPELVRSYQRMSERAMLEASGREFLSKAERREARAQALSRADQEARSGAHRRMKQVPVYWHLRRGEVYLGSGASNVIEAFSMLFRETFDLSPVPAGAGEVAARWAAHAGEGRALDDCKPAHLVTPPDGAETAADAIPLNRSAGKDFLGTEWLTWLWYTSHVESAEVATQLGRSTAVAFEKSLQLDCAFRISGSALLRADAPTRLPESAVALAGGKRPVRAGLQIGVEGETFSLAVRADPMNFSGVVLPAAEDAVGPRAVLEDRMEKLQQLVDAVGELYGAFLKRRFSSKWPQTLAALRAWVVASGHAAPAELSAAS